MVIQNIQSTVSRGTMKPELLTACNTDTCQVDRASSHVSCVIKHSLLTQTIVSHPLVVSVSWVLQTGVAIWFIVCAY